MQTKGFEVRRLTDAVLDARESRSCINVCGGNTKSFYGGLPVGHDLTTSTLSGISSYEPSELVVTVLAGTPLTELENALTAEAQCLPFEPPRFSAGGTVGGMVASGLAGPARASAGPLRDFVLGVTVLDGSGELLTFGGQVMKNVAGYDVSRLMVGAMGTLGILCELSLKVMPLPPARASLCFDIDEAPAITQLNRWAAQPLPINASAWYQGKLLVRLAGARASVDTARQRLGGTELDGPTADNWWSMLRDHKSEFFCLNAAQLAAGEQLWRLSVPDTTAPLGLPGDQLIEWGGAQRWWRGASVPGEIRSIAVAAGGHATLMRAADKSAGVFTPPTAVSMQIHKRLKQVFDPSGIFNLGRLYADF